jgi:hypothetical protein
VISRDGHKQYRTSKDGESNITKDWEHPQIKKLNNTLENYKEIEYFFIIMVRKMIRVSI